MGCGGFRLIRRVTTGVPGLVPCQHLEKRKRTRRLETRFCSDGYSPLTLGLVLANNAVQYRIARVNAARVVTACEEFRLAKGMYPDTLDELVPQYMPAVPRAKHCLMFGAFLYWSADGTALLTWYAVPPFGRWSYGFENRQWRYVD